jgi:hypothetical protein
VCTPGAGYLYNTVTVIGKSNRDQPTWNCHKPVDGSMISGVAVGRMSAT